MKIMIRYCKHMRKDGSYNTVVFDDENRTYSDCDSILKDSNYVFVEAQMSKDVDSLRDALAENGYRKVG